MIIVLLFIDVQIAVALGTGIETRIGIGIETGTATEIVEGTETETEAGIGIEKGIETEIGTETGIEIEVALPLRPLQERLTTETWLLLYMAEASTVEEIVGVGRKAEAVVEGETGKGLALGNGVELTRFRSSRAINNILLVTAEHGFYCRSV